MCFSVADGLWHGSVTQASPSVVVPSSKHARRIEPHHTTTNTSTTGVATIQKTPPPCLLLLTSVGYSVIYNSQLMSPSDTNMTQTSGQTLRSQPSYLIVDSSAGNSVGNSHQSQLKSPDSVNVIQTTVATHVPKRSPSYLILASSARNSISSSNDGYCQSSIKSPGGMGTIQTSTAALMSSGSIYVVSHSSTSSALVSCVANASPFLAMNDCGGSNMVVQPAGVQSSTGVMATLLLPATPLVQIITNGSAQFPAVQYVLPSPTVQTVTLQSPSNSAPVATFVQKSSTNCIPVANLQAIPVRQLSSLGNTKSTVVELSSSVGNSQSTIIRPPLGNSQEHAVWQSSSECLPVGRSQLSDIVGSPVSSVVWPSFGNSKSNVAHQSPSYCLSVGNSKSSSIVGIPVSLVNSAHPQIVLLGQNAGLTAASQPKPQLLHHSSSVASATQ